GSFSAFRSVRTALRRGRWNGPVQVDDPLTRPCSNASDAADRQDEDADGWTVRNPRLHADGQGQWRHPEQGQAHTPSAGGPRRCSPACTEARMAEGARAGRSELPATAEVDAVSGPPYGLRGSTLPEHRRVLGEWDGHFHDPR